MSTVSFRGAMVRLFGEEGDVAVDANAQIPILTSVILITDIALLSPLIADLATVFSVSETRAGLLIVVYATPLVVLIPLMGVVADRVGRKRVLVPGLVVFGLGGAAIALVPSFEVALGLRVLQAVGYASAMPIAIALLGDLYTGDRETTAQGIRTAGINVSIIAVPAISGLLFVRSWRFPFALYLLALPIAAWAWFTLPEVDVGEGGSLREYVTDQFQFLRHPVMVMLIVTFAMRFYLLYGFLTYISVLAIRGVGLSVVLAGLVVSVKGVLSFASSTQAGRAATEFGPTASVLGGFLLGGVGYVVMGIVTTPVMLIAGTVLFAVGDGVLSPSQKSLINRTAPPDLRGGAVSVATTFQNVGKVVGPAALGVLLGFVGPGQAFLVFGAVGGAVGTALTLGVLALPDPS